MRTIIISSLSLHRGSASVVHVLEIDPLEVGVPDFGRVERGARALPCFMMPTRVPDSFARKRSCVAISTATSSALSCARSTENSLAAFGSRPDVGSSSKQRLGFFGHGDRDAHFLPHAL